MATKKLSPLMRKYNTLRKRKSSFCEGRVNKKSVKDAAKSYIDAAVKNGQSKTEATKKANRILNAGCKTTSAKKRKATKRRRRTRK